MIGRNAASLAGRALERTPRASASARPLLAQHCRRSLHYAPALPRTSGIPCRDISRPWTRRLPQSLIRSSLSETSVRFSSTAPPTAPVEQPSTLIPDDSATSIERIAELTKEEMRQIPEQIGYLKELGLDYGWGPTASIEWLLEHIHIYTESPWWLSIVLTAVTIRLLLIKPFIDAADVTAKIGALRHVTEPINARIKELAREKKTVELLKHKAELQLIYKQAGIKTWKSFIPLIQIFTGFGMFRLLRGMSALPVPGFEEGVAWIPDLTLSDPYFILPLVTGGIYYVTMRNGGETGMMLMSPTMMKLMQYGLPLLTTFFMSYWPAALQLSFFITGAFGMLQSRLFRSPRFRNFVGISPIVRPPTSPSGASAPPPSPYTGTLNLASRKKGPASDPTKPGFDAPEKMPKPKGVVDGALAEVRGMGVEMKKSWDTLKGQAAPLGKRSDAEKRQAEAYEERRRKEIAQERWNRMEIQKEKMIEREELKNETQKKQKKRRKD